MWTYVQASGAVLTPSGNLMTYGYSGAVGYKNIPGYQAIANKGPIPTGKYTIEPPRDTPDHGPYAMPLVPDPANNMHGRSGFLIHGDSVTMPGTASEGCVILPRFARERIWDSDDRDLQVISEQIEQA